MTSLIRCAAALCAIAFLFATDARAEDDFSRLLQQVIEQPENPAVHYAIGKWYADHGQYKEAVAELTIGSAAPGREGADAVHRLILCLLEIGDADKANQWGIKAVDRGGPITGVLALSLKAALAAKDSPTAGERIEQIIRELEKEISPADRDACRHALGLALESGTPDEATRAKLRNWAVADPSREPRLALQAARGIIGGDESGRAPGLADTAWQILKRIGDDTDRIRGAFVYSDILKDKGRRRAAAAVLIELDGRYESAVARENVAGRVAALLLQASDSAAALPWLEKSWNQSRRDPDRALTFARALAESGNPDRALAVAAPFASPSTSARELEQIRALLQSILPAATGNQALQKNMEPFLPALPGLLPVQRFAAERLEREGRLEDALVGFERLIAADAGETAGRAAAARVASKLNRWPDVLRLLQNHPDLDRLLLREAQFRGLDAKQRDARENILYVDLLIERGRLEQAWTALKSSGGEAQFSSLPADRLAALYPHAADRADRAALARHLNARFAAEESWEKAARWAKLLHELEPAAIDAWRAHIDAALRLGRRNEASELTAQAVEAGHKDLIERVELRVLYATHLISIGDAAAADQLKALLSNQEVWLDTPLRDSAITVFRRAGDLESERALWEMVLGTAQSPDSAAQQGYRAASVKRADEHIRARRWADAARVWEEIAQNFPRDAEAHEKWIETLLRAGDEPSLRQARRLLDTLKQLSGESTAWRKFSLEVLLRLKLKAEALALLKSPPARGDLDALRSAQPDDTFLAELHAELLSAEGRNSEIIDMFGSRAAMSGNPRLLEILTAAHLNLRQWPQALACLEARPDSATPAVVTERARLLSLLDRPADALRLTASQPNARTDPATRWRIAELLMAQNKAADAIVYYRELAALPAASGFSDSAAARLGVCHAEREEFEAALPYLKRALAGPAADDSVYFFWTLIQWRLKRLPDNPGSVIDRLKKLKGRTADGIRLAGLLELERSNLVSASAAFLYCLNKNPKDAAAAYWLAETLKRQGRIADAGDVIKPVAGLHPLINALYAELLELRADTAAAAAWWLKSGGDPQIAAHAAWLMFRMGDYQQARRMLAGISHPAADLLDAAAALKQFESGARVAALPAAVQNRILAATGEWERLDRPAPALQESGDLARAQQLLEHGNPHAAYTVIDLMEIHGMQITPLGRWVRGRAAYELGWYGRAEEELTAAKRDVPRARADLAALMLLKDDPRAALNLLESKSTPADDDPRRASLLAAALAQTGRLDAADSVLAAARPQIIGVRYNRARLLERRGNLQQASELHQQIASDSPVFYPSVQRLAELAFQDGQWQSAQLHFRHLLAIPATPPQLIADARRKLVEIEVLLKSAGN